MRNKYNRMGNKLVIFTEDQLEAYQDCTFFTRKEILKVFEKFRKIRPDLVPKQMQGDQASEIMIPLEDMIEKLPDLYENPFKKQICRVFSRDGDGNLSFVDFLDLFSVFSEDAPKEIKLHYAFKIYDFDGDEFIGPEDLCQVLQLLTNYTHDLTFEEKKQIVEKVIEEGDIDDDGRLSFTEFEYVIERSPDFFSTFHIRL